MKPNARIFGGPAAALWLLLALLVSLSACGKPAHRTRVLDTPDTRHLKGYEKPYTVDGDRYDPLRSHQGFSEEGLASWYGKDFHGRPTSNGEIYDMYAMTAAHKILPLGVWVKVTHLGSGREAVVRINDRGPFVKGRIIDLSYTAATALRVVGPGTAPVRIEALGYRVEGREGAPVYQRPASFRVASYTVQVGAFAQQANADRLSAALQRQHGYAGVQEGWVGGQRFYRVRVGRYPTLEEAEAAKENFERGDYPNAFVVAME